MKKIIGFLTALMMCFTLSSCVTTAQAQIDDMYDNVDVSVIVTYGTPYYNTEGLLLYYMYRDMFYYPYYYNNRYYFHRYHKPLPPHMARRYKPLPRNFHRGITPHRNYVTPPNKSTYHVKPNVPHNRRGTISRPNTNINRGSGAMARPSMPRSSTRVTTNSHGHFGGRR